MLQPKKQKYRKHHKGRSRSRIKEMKGTMLNFGSVGLQARGAAWITANQIEAARRTITRHMRREGKLWIRIFPDKPITKFPPEVTMGGGKGNVDHYVVPVRPGRMLFEVDGVDQKTAVQALTFAGYKLPIKTMVVTKEL